MEMNQAAFNGYHGNENPHMYSSPLWYAHEFGRYLHATGRSTPNGVRMSRGYSIRGNGMLFRITGDSKPVFERIN